MSCLLEVRSVSKRFPGVLALENVSLMLGHGEVLAVVGENGAGKSTLMKILAGVQTPDSGDILLDGTKVEIDSVRAAQRLGIALIHQELNLADNLTVAANIFLGREPRRGWFIQKRETETASTSVSMFHHARWSAHFLSGGSSWWKSPRRSRRRRA
jgi:ribose transport system ATP-binding protein